MFPGYRLYKYIFGILRIVCYQTLPINLYSLIIGKIRKEFNGLKLLIMPVIFLKNYVGHGF